MATYADTSDIEDRWRTLSPAETTRATTFLDDASSILRLAVPDLDTRIAADSTGDLARAAKVAVVEAVLRVMRNPYGAKRIQETIGDKAYTLDMGDERSGLFVTVEEAGPLQPSGGVVGGQALGTAIVQTRPGWAPCDPYADRFRTGGWWPTS